MEKHITAVPMEQQFGEVVNIIVQHKSQASAAVNREMLLTAWQVGAYVSAKLKSEEWGSKVVTELSEYIRSKRPDIKGFSRRNIYNMVMFYEEYSSPAFLSVVEKYLNAEFVQPAVGQIESHTSQQNDSEIIQTAAAQIETMLNSETAIVQTVPGQIVQTLPAQLPKILKFTTSKTNQLWTLRN